MFKIFRKHGLNIASDEDLLERDQLRLAIEELNQRVASLEKELYESDFDCFRTIEYYKNEVIKPLEAKIQELEEKNIRLHRANQGLVQNLRKKRQPHNGRNRNREERKLQSLLQEFDVSDE